MNVRPRTSFEWPMYADATLAGLSVLIPLPLVDTAFERFFRRRMPAGVARSRGRTLPPSIQAELHPSSDSWMRACLMLPLTLTVGLVQRLSRKLLYFLTIKEASDKLSYYWHRAFLLDYMLASGHLESVASAARAQQAMELVLASTSSPLNQLAGQVVGRSRHVWRMLRQARRGAEDPVLQQTKAQLEQRWGDFAGYFQGVASRYEQQYQALQSPQQAV